MKKLFYAIATLAVVASCAKVAEVETNVEPKDGKNLVHMTIRAEAPQTKTFIDQTGAKTYQPGWNQGDQLAVFFDAVKDNKDAVLDNYGDTGKAAEFNGDVTIANGDHTVYGFYPATTVFKKGDNDTKVQLQVATVQRPYSYAFDPDADIAVGKALGINVTSSDVTINNMVFARLLSTVKVKITESNDDIAPGEKINAITIRSSESNLTGVIEWDYDTQLATAVSDDNTVTADLSANPIDFDTPIFVLVNPTTMSAGSSLIITVSTDSHEITKTIPSLPKDINFPLGGIAELNINLDNTAAVAVGAAIEEPTPSSNGWFLVKKAHWLRPGDEVAFVAENSGTYYAMSTEQKSNNRGAIAAIVSNDVLTINDNIQRFTLEIGSEANSSSFNCINGTEAGKYIYAASASSNYLRSISYKDDDGSFYIDIDESGVATIIAKAEVRNDLRFNYNGGSPLFSCYASTSTLPKVSIYKHYCIPSLQTPTNLEAIAVDDDVMVSWNAVAGADSYTVTCGETVQTGIKEKTYIFENLADGTYTVTVKAISNDHSTMLDSEVASTSVVVGTSYYVKVTSTAKITDGDYLIVYEDGAVAFNGGLATLDAANNTISVTIDEGRIISNSTTNAAKFTINVSDGTILSASGKYIGKTANANGLDSGATAYTNTFTIDSGNAIITASGGTTLRFNKASDQKRFRYYKSGQQPIQLYKLQ